MVNETDSLQFVNNVADRLRTTFPNAQTAFLTLKGETSVLKQLRGLEATGNLATVDADPHTELGKQVLSCFLEGFRESQRTGPGAYRELLGPRLPFELVSDPLRVAHTQGIVMVPDVLLTPKEVREGIEKHLQISCGHSQAVALIRHLDSSWYLSRDGRLTFQDFERLYSMGKDPLARTLAQAARDVTLSDTATLGDRAVVVEAKRRKAQAAAERARRRGEKALRDEIAATRHEFEVQWLMRRLSAEYDAAEDANQAAMVPGPGLLVSLSVNRNKPMGTAFKVEIQLLNRLVPPLSPLMALAALDLQANQTLGGTLLGSEVRLALSSCGVDMTASEIVRLITTIHRGAAPGSPAGRATSPQRSLAALPVNVRLPPARVSWVDVVTRMTEGPSGGRSPGSPRGNARPDERLMPSYVRQQLQDWAAAVSRWYRQYEGRDSNFYDLCGYVPFWPFGPPLDADTTLSLPSLSRTLASASSSSITEAGSFRDLSAVPPSAHPVMAMPFIEALADAVDSQRRTMLRMLRLQDQEAAGPGNPPRGTVNLGSLRYAITTAAGRRLNPLALTLEQYETLGRSFPGPSVPGLAAKVLGEHRQINYPLLCSYVGPLLALTHYEKLSSGLTPEELTRQAADPMAVLSQLCAQLYVVLVGLTRALYDAAGPARKHLVTMTEFRAALSDIAGVQLSDTDVAQVDALLCRYYRGQRLVDVRRFLLVLEVKVERVRESSTGATLSPAARQGSMVAGRF